jgi:hypothetical protein
MTDPISLFVTIGTQLKVAADMAVGLSKLHTSAEVDAKAIELQRVILSLLGNAVSAQVEQSSMIQRISDLEEEIRRAKAWEETKQHYKLRQPRPGTFVYTFQDQGENSEPVHWICANCYEESKKSILQAVKTTSMIIINVDRRIAEQKYWSHLLVGTQARPDSRQHGKPRLHSAAHHRADFLRWRSSDYDSAAPHLRSSQRTF